MRKRQSTPALLLSLLMGFGAAAQQNMVAAGAEASGSGGKLSYTVGQPGFTTQTGGGFSLAQGVQQPFEISVVTGLSENRIRLEASVFPNPAVEMLTLTVTEGETTGLYYQLLDALGNVHREGHIRQTSTQLPMAGLSPGTYMLRLRTGASEIKTFQILKNQ